MFLSKVTIEHTPQARSEFLKVSGNGSYSAHQLIWRLFSDNQSRDFLFREEMSSAGEVEYYVLSAIEPDNSDQLFRIQSKAFTPNLRNDQRLAFKLRVNPTISIVEGGKQRRHDVLMHAKRQARENDVNDSQAIQLAMEQAAQAWICNEKRLDTWGIQLDVAPSVERYTQHKSKKRSGDNISFSSVDFDGILTIKNVDKFLSQYQKGFGRAKSMGCGLMLIRPI
jgi:CRISPR system Cascade subunit CasE